MKMGKKGSVVPNRKEKNARATPNDLHGKDRRRR